MSNHLKDPLKNVTESFFKEASIIPLQTPLSFPYYQDWIDKGYQAEMDFLSESLPVRKDPSKLEAKAQSLIMVRAPYFPHPEASEKSFKSLKIAHYAQGKDYHFWFRDQLKGLIEELQKLYPNEHFISYTDSVPLLERDFAAQAGLGWIGKNTCLIDRKEGSLFFIGEILTSLEVENSPEPIPDFCGKCTACMDSCPTQAFEEPRVLNAQKCIAFWNIESRGIPPLEMREPMGDWFFGCDICQTVCPWNIKIHKFNENFVQKSTETPDIEDELRMILESSNKKLMKFVAETPLNRAGGRGLKRNALIVIGNRKIHSLKDSVETYLDHEILGELAQWTLDQLS